MNHLWKKYKQMPLPAKSAIWFTICNILQKGIAFITVPIFTRIMVDEQYGIFSLYQSYLSIITIFATLQLSDGVFNTGMIKFREERDRFASSLLGLSTAVTLIIASVFIIFRKLTESMFQVEQSVIMLIMVELAFTSAITLWSARQKFDYHYKSLIFVTLSIAALNPILGICLVMMANNNQALYRILSIVIVQAIFGIFIYIRMVQKGKAVYDGKYWKYALRFNIPLIPHYLSLAVLSAADKIMIGDICGKAAAAIYSVAYSAAMVLTIVKNSINQAFIPWLYRGIRDKKYKELKKYSNGIMLLVTAITFLFIMMAPEIIKILGDANYYSAVWAIPPVAASSFFMFLYNLFANVEFYYEENKFVMVASIVAAITNIILNACLIPIFGFVTAGYTTLFCYMILSLLHYLYMRSICKKHLGDIHLYDEKFILMLIVALFVVIAISLLVYEYFIIRYIFIVCFSIIVIIKRRSIILFMKTILKK